MVVWVFTDYNTTPTKVVLSCFGLLVGLWQQFNNNYITISIWGFRTYPDHFDSWLGSFGNLYQFFEGGNNKHILREPKSYHIT